MHCHKYKQRKTAGASCLGGKMGYEILSGFEFVDLVYAFLFSASGSGEGAGLEQFKISFQFMIQSPITLKPRFLACLQDGYHSM